MLVWCTGDYRDGCCEQRSDPHSYVKPQQHVRKQHDGSVVNTITSQQEVPKFDSWFGTRVFSLWSLYILLVFVWVDTSSW